MSRYIDADKVKEYILSTGFYCDTEADRKYSAELIDELFPTADVVEVVRCKDCKYYIEREDGHICANDYLYKDSDWFCADGEKNG